MPRSWRSSLVVAAAALAAAAAPPQAPNYRVTYRLRVLEGHAPEPRLLATAVVSGPPETALRLSLHTDPATLEGLLATLPEPDTVNVAGVFFSRRPAGRSRRGLPLWEEDSYRRWTRIAWGGTARLYPFGPAGVAQHRDLWVDLTVGREFAAGETRASEEVTVVDSAVALNVAAVVPPRRVTVRLALVRGDTASSPRVLDLVPEAAGRRVSFALGGARSEFDVTLERPEPPRTGRDSALAVDAEVVCLRLLAPGGATPARIRCGRLDNVARRLALTGGDTLVATFAWPSVR
ncbi:MAG TPA: hypothetical protein VH116_04650 [Gemmatimonadales bacterium]|nr:hypothetical protein [Gemmatimonadales bacterium]